MPSPVRADDHGEPHFDLIGWMALYRAHTPGIAGGDNSSLKLDLDNMPQPDAYLRILAECGGLARIVGGYVTGSPELIGEVTASTASYDLHDKLNAYRRNGVLEYIVWRVWDLAVDWFVLREGQYSRLEPDGNDVFRSEVFPGLWLDARGLVEGDLARVLAVLQQGLADPAHAALVQRLEAARNSGA
jgi:Uma2 family endonuclease